MPRALESVILVAFTSLFATGCCLTGGAGIGPFANMGTTGGTDCAVAQQNLFASQRHAQQLVASQQAINQQYSTVVTERDNITQMAQALEQEKIALGQHIDTMGQQLASAQADLNVANQRVANLVAERGQIQQRYASLLDEQDGALSDSLAGRFQDLANRYPDIDFDPSTGMSRFNGEILFNSGSAALKPNSQQMLREFASVLNDNEAAELKVLVVGHTDDQRIANKATYTKHKSNWHLSTNRANAVVLALKKMGISEGRLAAMGYSKYQPVTDNYDDTARRQNRRVEIYVLAPDALIAQWDPRATRS